MRQLAYLARYANQRLPDLLAMTLADLNLLEECISEIVTRENGKEE